LREAVALDARDLSTHRRLAAALALAGDKEAAVQEYARFIRDLRDAGDVGRAKIEVAYAMGQLSDVPGVESLERIADGDGGSPAPADASAREVSPRSAFGGSTALRPQSADHWASPAGPAPATRAGDPWAAPGPVSRTPLEDIPPRARPVSARSRRRSANCSCRRCFSMAAMILPRRSRPWLRPTN